MSESKGHEPVTVVVSHRVVGGRERDFERWQHGITEAARAFPGYVGTELFRPVPDVQEEWVAVFRFVDPDSLRCWLQSQERASWLAEAGAFVDGYAMQKVGGGLGGWFSPRPEDSSRPTTPPDWKQALAVLIALYPIVMLLTVFVSPWLESLGIRMPTSMFIGNVLSVALLQWIAMPPLTRWLAPWLQDDGGPKTLAWTSGLLVACALMVLGFELWL